MRVAIERDGGVRAYEVPSPETTVTVMDVLDYIRRNLDHTLAYYRHSSCNQGICGRCAVRLNGKVVLACAALLEPGTASIALAPANGTVVRDLVTRETEG